MQRFCCLKMSNYGLGGYYAPHFDAFVSDFVLLLAYIS